MKKAIIGAGGFGREVFWSLSPIERIGSVFFVDDVYWKDNTDNVYPLSKFNPEEYEVIIAVGSPEARAKIVEALPKSTRFFTHIHKSAQLLFLVSDFFVGTKSLEHALNVRILFFRGHIPISLFNLLGLTNNPVCWFSHFKCPLFFLLFDA